MSKYVYATNYKTILNNLYNCVEYQHIVHHYLTNVVGGKVERWEI